MLGRWIRHLLWRPFELGCRLYPLLPLHADVTQPVEGVTCIRINNVVTRLLSRFGGGYDYAVCYLVDDTLLVDTGFPWARHCLRQTLIGLGADKKLRQVVNTHYHEDHTGNNDLLVELTSAEILASPGRSRDPLPALSALVPSLPVRAGPERGGSANRRAPAYQPV